MSGIDRRNSGKPSKSRSNSRTNPRRSPSSVETAELLKSIPEPKPPEAFLYWIKEQVAALRLSSDPETFVARLMDELLENDFIRATFSEALIRWLLVSWDDPGSGGRRERLKRDGGLDAEGFSSFLSYVIARAERAEELYAAASINKSAR